MSPTCRPLWRTLAWAASLLAVVVGMGCGSGAPAAGLSTQVTTQARGNFVLYVSDQSFALDRVDITIRIDGRVAVADEFTVGNEHNWHEYRFRLPPGLHRLSAVSRDGRARLEGSFRIKDRLYGVVDYWYSPGNPGGERKLTFQHSSARFSFA